MNRAITAASAATLSLSLLTNPASAIVQAPLATAPSPDDAPPDAYDRSRASRLTLAHQGIIDGRLAARKRGKSDVVRLGDRRYAEIRRKTTDKLFTILVEFGDRRHPDFPDVTRPGDPNPPTVFDGPSHNEIAKPDRSADNSTIWQQNYDRRHYQELYFGGARDGDSLRAYLHRQSDGTYSIAGKVSDWVRVPYNEARYGRATASGDDANPWQLIRDATSAWYASQRAAGRTPAQLRSALRAHDRWDRYDFDGDGDFNEGDGYLDHVQIVHAGIGQEALSGAQGSDALWSHHWYAFGTDAGRTGPARNRAGGTEVGSSGVWAGDYVIVPENSGLGVIAHEYGHDLGLPDEYDTTRRTYAPVGFWSAMSTGSQLSKDRLHGRGTTAGDLNAWDKLQLGWLDYAVATAGQARELRLSPSSRQGRHPGALVVRLPRKERRIPLTAPPEGRKAWWSTMGQDVTATLAREVDIPPAARAQLTFATWYETWRGHDFGYVEIRDGDRWKTIRGNITDGAANNGIHGSSKGAWTTAAFDLSAYAGKRIGLRFRYQTGYQSDGGTTGRGFLLDRIALTADGRPVFTDGAEDGTGGWSAYQFRATGDTATSAHPAYYLVENRQWLGYDTALRNSFSYPGRRAQPQMVEFYASRPGMLISYWDASMLDNNVSAHPGEGRILHVDASPKPVESPRPDPQNGWKYWNATQQLYDAPFGTTRIPSMILHQGDEPGAFPAHDGVPRFDDTGKYWFTEQPHSGVKLPAAGVAIRVLAAEPGGVLRVGLR